MSVTDFECAIAKSQIGRYIAGDNLAPEIARQLESHIDNCARCKQLLQEKKDSLEAMISDSDDSDFLEVDSSSNLRTNGSSALKPDYMGVLADSARMSLREKLKDSSRIKSESTEIPVVAPAFAYREAPEPETLQLPIETPAKAPKKGGLSLAAFALFREVPDDGVKPSLSAGNIQSAKAVFHDNNQSLKKPMMYLAGLCAVVAAMSFVLRDPTTLFGNKLSPKTAAISASPAQKKPAKTVKKPVTKVAKILPHKPAQLNDRGMDAHSFTNEPAPTRIKTPAPKITKSKKISKLPTASKPVRSDKPVKANKLKLRAKPEETKTIRRTQPQHFVAPTKSQPKRIKPARKQAKPEPKENVVKLYPTDPTPSNQEQN